MMPLCKISSIIFFIVPTACNAGCIAIVTTLVIVALLSLLLAVTYVPYDVYLKGSGDCTEYEVVTPEPVLCGEGSSRRYDGVSTTIVEETPQGEAIRASLVDRSDLKFYSQDKSLPNNSEPLRGNVRFNSGHVVYTWSGSVIFGSCCVENQDSINQTATLEIYDSYDNAFRPGGGNRVFSETITAEVDAVTCFQDWSNENPFVVEKSAYYIFALRSAADSNMNYATEMTVHQQFVNTSDYTNTNYFTSSNYSYFPYRGGVTNPTDYVTICEAPPPLIDPGNLHVQSCPKSRPWVKGLFIAFIPIGTVLFFVLVVAIVYYCIHWKRKMGERPSLQATT